LSDRTRLTLIRLGWQEWAVVIIGLAAVLAIVAVAAAYDWANLYAEQVGVRRFEVSLGFKWSTLRTNDPSLPTTTLGIVEVVPGGAFDRLGLRAGDVPFGHSGKGAYEMMLALRESARGRTGSFDAVNVHDWRNSFRQITVPSLKSLEQPASREQPLHAQSASCWSDPRISSILALGKEHAPDAHAKLAALSAETDESEGRAMARAILQNWDEKEASYQSSHAQRIGELIVTPEEKQKVLPRVFHQTVLVFGVLVDDRGCTTKVEVVRRGAYPAFLQLVLAKVKALHYVPKKDGTNYVADTFVLMFNQEVD
jgi:hypothetical protein